MWCPKIIWAIKLPEALSVCPGYYVMDDRGIIWQYGRHSTSDKKKWWCSVNPNYLPYINGLFSSRRYLVRPSKVKILYWLGLL